MYMNTAPVGHSIFYYCNKLRNLAILSIDPMMCLLYMGNTPSIEYIQSVTISHITNVKPTHI